MILSVRGVAEASCWQCRRFTVVLAQITVAGLQLRIASVAESFRRRLWPTGSWLAAATMDLHLDEALMR